MLDRYRKKKLIISLVAGIALLLIMILTLKSCTRLIKAPEKGEKAPKFYDSGEIPETDRLVVSGAHASKNAMPGKYGVLQYVNLEGIRIDYYDRQQDSSFTINEEQPQGILTFRGNSMRDGGTSGNTMVSKGVFSSTWKYNQGKSVSVVKNLDNVGQPLIITWSKEKLPYVRVSENKKKKDSLTEVICTGPSGEITFLDIEDGTMTRNPIKLSLPVTGTASISPDGTPLYVVGAGGCSSDDISTVFIINLYTGEIIKKFGERYNFAANPPEECYNFSSSALFSYNGDCLVYQAENGVTYSYTVKKSMSAGELSVEFVQELKYTYSANLESGGQSPGYTNASACAAFGSYIFQGDDNGNLVCLDANRQSMVWIRNLGDCILSSPVIENDKNTGNVYIYIGTALKAREGKTVKDMVYLYKLNAANGETVWEREEEVCATKKMNGGAVATPLLGKGGLSGKIYFALCGTDGKKSGKLLCIDKENGNQEYNVWFRNYIYSSPVAAYTKDGDGFVIICDNKGNIFSLAGKSGKTKDIRKIGERITATPVIFDDTLVVVSENTIYGIAIE
ncbi:MAG: PQQ-binding-like beta-propeller repeat protein [Clostridiales bacterium]|nr:PQQ-binding-like beta-propeller repeat protein [Clostridiales bacterium]